MNITIYQRYRPLKLVIEGNTARYYNGNHLLKETPCEDPEGVIKAFKQRDIPDIGIERIIRKLAKHSGFRRGHQ